MSTKVSELPSESLPTATDYVVLLDTETNTLKKVLVSELLADNGLIGVGGLADSAVMTAKINDSAVTSEKLSTTIAFRAYGSSAQNSGAGAFAAMTFPTEVYDYGADFASNEFTAPVNGLYHFNARTHTTGTPTRFIIALYVNPAGAGYAEHTRGSDWAHTTGEAGTSALVSADIPLNSGDKVKAYCYGNVAVALNTASTTTYFCGHLVGRV